MICGVFTDGGSCTQSAFHIVGAGVVKSVGIPNTSHVEYDYTIGERSLSLPKCRC
jgi:hypothetical protein